MDILQRPLLEEAYPPPILRRLPLREQPAYRVASNPAACTLSELLAVIIGGSSQIELTRQVLERFPDLQALDQAHVQELSKVPGLGCQTALRLKAALSLGRKLMEPAQARQTIAVPEDAYRLLRPLLEGKLQEHLLVLVLDTRNHVLESVEIYQGSVNYAQVRLAELFRPAVRLNAPGLLLAHNHPSGDPNPSPDDISLTRAAIQAGLLLEIQVVDHIILGAGNFISLKQNGLAFS